MPGEPGSGTTVSAEEAAPALRVRRLEKSYKVQDSPVPVFTNVDLNVATGSFTSLIGPSGCGKSTLLLCMAGLETPDVGGVESFGKPVSGPPDEVIYIFQQYTKSVFPWRTVRQNAAYGLEVMGTSRREIAARTGEILERVGLSRFVDHFPSQLSGGMQQRLAIARALVCRPKVLLMDEPFSAVDALTRAQLQDLTLDVWTDFGLTVVFVTHDVDEAVYLSDRVIALADSPARVALDMPVPLPRPRDQLTTRESADYAGYRHQLLELVLAQHAPSGAA